MGPGRWCWAGQGRNRKQHRDAARQVPQHRDLAHEHFPSFMTVRWRAACCFPSCFSAGGFRGCQSTICPRDFRRSADSIAAVSLEIWAPPSRCPPDEFSGVRRGRWGRHRRRAIPDPLTFSLKRDIVRRLRMFRQRSRGDTPAAPRHGSPTLRKPIHGLAVLIWIRLRRKCSDGGLYTFGATRIFPTLFNDHRSCPGLVFARKNSGTTCRRPTALAKRGLGPIGS